MLAQHICKPVLGTNLYVPDAKSLKQYTVCTYIFTTINTVFTSYIDVKAAIFLMGTFCMYLIFNYTICRQINTEIKEWKMAAPTCE